MKLLVETVGQFMLVDGLQEIQATRPSVISPSHFFSERVSRNQINVLAELKDEATDLEFKKFLAESNGDMDLAVESFLSTFGAEKVSKKGKR
jgi:hypothetical protein